MRSYHLCGAAAGGRRCHLCALGGEERSFSLEPALAPVAVCAAVCATVCAAVCAAVLVAVVRVCHICPPV